MAGYSDKAQPFLDATGAAVLPSVSVRDWLIIGTPAAEAYADSTTPAEERRARRGVTKQPF